MKAVYALVFLLFFLCCPASLAGQTAEDNVLRQLAAFHLEDSLTVVWANTEGIGALPNRAGSGDALAADLRNDRQHWRNDPFVRLAHHGAIAGWRAKRHPSLHVIEYPDEGVAGYRYEAHFDSWAPSFLNPVATVCHFFRDFIPQKWFGAVPNEAAIGRKLDRQGGE